MNYFTIIITFLLLLCRLIPAETQKLPSLESLKELPVEIAADFFNHDDIASPAMPVMAKDGTMFFYDAKLKQVFKTHLDNHTLLPLSRQGEGPKEYIDIRDMLIDGKFVYMIDGKQKLLCFGTDGTYKWEKRTDIRYDHILAKKGDTFYLMGTSYDRSAFLFKRLYKWSEGKKRQLVTQLPQLYAEVGAMNPQGEKIVKAVGIFFFAKPVFCVYKDKDMIITAADNQYRFNLLNINGSPIKTISVNAPLPHYSKYQKQFIKIFKDKPYAIFDIFCEPPYIVIISNYFKEDKPRVDFFSMEGILKKSFLMPVKMNPETLIFTRRGRLAEIVNGFLLYTDLDEVGFIVYKIKPGDIH
jgi:hypothetical protein